MFNVLRISGISFIILFIISTLQAKDQWPKYIPLKNDGKITIYQPQPEKLEGNKLTGRAAVSVKKTAKNEPVFGAIFFVATIATDKDKRVASLESIYIKDVKFPGVADTTKLKAFTSLLETEVPKWNLEVSLDALITSIEQENSVSANDNFKNDPPEIIFKTKPTALILLDGDPKIQKDKNLDADRVVNTPALIFKEGDQWNLYSGGLWYKSSDVMDGWKQNKSLSDKVKSVDEQIKKKEKENNSDQDAAAKPEVTDILVVKKPTELLQSKGEPEYKSIQSTLLLYISNSHNDIFKTIDTQQLYVLLSGRWYTAEKFNGKWTYVSPDKLPPDFKKIPPGSEKDNVLASVPGTQAAEDAKMDAQIPQTAKVNRKTATVKVEYDGSPQFKAIEGTSLQLAENSSVTVIKNTDGQYYAVDNGIWFKSTSPGRLYPPPGYAPPWYPPLP